MRGRDPFPVPLFVMELERDAEQVSSAFPPSALLPIG